MPPPPKRFPITVLVVLTVFVLLGTAIALVVEAWSCGHPDIVVPTGGSRKWARVAILMDGTASIGEQRFARIKQIVREQILPALGIDDEVVGCDVQPGHAGLANEVFGFSREQQPPRLSEPQRASILSVLAAGAPGARRTGAAANRLYQLIRDLEPLWQTLAEVRRDWMARLQNRPSSAAGGSNICGALAEIGGWFGASQPNTERWLFVLSDMKQEGGMADCGPHPALPFPRDVQVRMIFSPQPALAEPFWQNFFDPKPPPWLPLARASGGLLLPPNPVAALEDPLAAGRGRYRVPAAWSCLRDALRGWTPRIGGGAIAAIWLAGLLGWLVRRS